MKLSMFITPNMFVRTSTYVFEEHDSTNAFKQQKLIIDNWVM